MKVGDKVHPIVNGEPVTSVVGTVESVQGGVFVAWPWAPNSLQLIDSDASALHLIEPPFVLAEGDLGRFTGMSGLRPIACNLAGREPFDPDLKAVWRPDPNDPNTLRCVWRREEQQ